MRSSGGADLRYLLNCHIHALLPEGVFVCDSYGALRFHLLPPPRDPDVARLVDQIARGIHKLVDRHFQDERDQNTDVLAHEQHAAITTTSPRVQLTTAATRAGNCAAFVAGYSLHAGCVIDGDERSALERLCRYGARAPTPFPTSRASPSGRPTVDISERSRALA